MDNDGPGPGETLAEYATRTLRDRIVLVDLAPGAPLDDEAFGRELGVGRTPVREAIKRLEVERLVTVFPRRGTFVATVDLTELAEISQIRAELEPLAASRAALHATPAQREQMRDLVSELAHLDTTAPARELLRHDLTVHRAIHAASASTHLAEALTRYGNLSTRMWVVLGDRLDVGAHIDEHVELLTSVIERDADRAAAIAREHVQSFEAMVRAAV